MLSRSEVVLEYRNALKKGQKYYHNAIAEGRYPYPQVLDELLGESLSGGGQEIGTLEIPMEHVIGTLAVGRRNAFAGNFMPLLEEGTEFSEKWINLCVAHLDTSGITDPIECVEYMGQFYVREGHKRVSVLRYFDAPTVRARVMRLVPPWSEEPTIRAYYEFMQFFKLSGTYFIQFTRPGRYARLQAGLGFAPDHVWTTEERTEILASLYHLQQVCQSKLPGDVRNITASEALLAYLDVYPYEELKKLSEAEIAKRLNALHADLRYLAQDGPSAVSTEPEIPEKGVIGRILDGFTRPVLNIAFVYASDPASSSWSFGHEQGRLHLESAVGDRIRTRAYVCDADTAEAVMEKAVAEGAQLLFAAASTLLSAARKTAAAHPDLKVLVCALSVPYAGIRTYYSRIYEAKFITGALAGALWRGGSIGYIASYPILGTPAAVNAFALGVRMTAPDARVCVAWSAMEGEPEKTLMAHRARIISGHTTTVQEASASGAGQNLVAVQPNGEWRPMASACWDWGRMYEQIVRGVIGGAWELSGPDHDSAISYWWGMSSGVIDVRLAESLPDGACQLADLLRRGIRDGSIDPFCCRIVDQNGILRNPGDQRMSPEELIHIDWLCENIDGRIPEIDELLPMSRETTRLLSVRPDARRLEEKR